MKSRISDFVWQAKKFINENLTVQEIQVLLQVFIIHSYQNMKFMETTKYLKIGFQQAFQSVQKNY